MAPTPSIVLCLAMQVTLAVLCLDVIYGSPLLCMVEFTSNSKTSLANEYKSTKVVVLLCGCHAAILFSVVTFHQR